MKNLKDILKGVATLQIVGEKNANIKNICTDSRQVKKGDVYVAIVGTNVDGHTFVDEVVKKGAKVVVCNALPKKTNEKIVYVVVADTATTAGLMLNNFYDDVSSKVNVVGVTGTNGKTSTVTLLYELFKKLGYKVGLLSTVVNIVDGKKIAATHTTPDVVALYALLNKMYKAKVKYVFMECSSHAISQNRIAGLKFKVCVFSNITHDHLDYHKTFKNYLYAKKMLFDNLNSDAYALSNLDDKNGKIVVQNTKAQKVFYSLKTICDFKGKIISNDVNGLELSVNGKNSFHSRLIGEFNAYNLLAVYATAILLKQTNDKVLKVLSAVGSPAGRFDKVISKNKKIYGIVDYAHTPDALENVLNTLNKIKTKKQKVITVVGCGGNRDKTKRPVMAKIAATKSNEVIITTDNPRNEEPLKIIEDMLGGLSAKEKKQVQVVVDRKEAIEHALQMANINDVVLVAGKGHETYQEIGNVKFDFNDKKVIENFFKKNNL